MKKPGFIPPHGNYRELLSYQKAEVVYDVTFRFCHKFLTRGDRTIDQMIQAARSGKQNISEGAEASGTSKEMELKLMGVARASLGELLNDYRDFLTNAVRDFSPPQMLLGARWPSGLACFCSLSAGSARSWR